MDSEDDWLNEDDDDTRRESDDDEWACCFPDKCCMPGTHHRSECYTPEMFEEYRRRAIRGFPL